MATLLTKRPTPATTSHAGACLKDSPRIGGYVNLARNATDGGNCLVTIDSVNQCAAISKSSIGIDNYLTIFTAKTAACKAFCAASICDTPTFIIFGPVLSSSGCCDQEIGRVSKPFGLWKFHNASTDYSLIPRLSLQVRRRAPSPAY